MFLKPSVIHILSIIRSQKRRFARMNLDPPELKPAHLMKNPNMQIECREVDRLVPSETNPRTHSAEQVEQIAASIQEFGFVNPILIGADGGIIAGEGRYRAALK